MKHIIKILIEFIILIKNSQISQLESIWRLNIKY